MDGVILFDRKKALFIFLENVPVAIRAFQNLLKDHSIQLSMFTVILYKKCNKMYKKENPHLRKKPKTY